MLETKRFRKFEYLQNDIVNLDDLLHNTTDTIESGWVFLGKSFLLSMKREQA